MSLVKKWKDSGILVDDNSKNEQIAQLLERLSEELKTHVNFDKTLFDKVLPFAVELYNSGVHYFDVTLMLACISMEDKVDNVVSLYKQQIEKLIK